MCEGYCESSLKACRVKRGPKCHVAVKWHDPGLTQLIDLDSPGFPEDTVAAFLVSLSVVDGPPIC